MMFGLETSLSNLAIDRVNIMNPKYFIAPDFEYPTAKKKQSFRWNFLTNLVGRSPVHKASFDDFKAKSGKYLQQNQSLKVPRVINFWAV